MIEILRRIMGILERVRGMEDLNTIATGVFGVILIFGLLNCLLGYRLLRFWMMVGGLLVGAGIGLFIASTLEVEGKVAYLGIMAGAGILLGAVAFLSYKIGVFVLGAGIGVSLTVYILHPTTSFVFFICLLAGAGLGTLGVKYSREVLICATSLMGGVMAGLSAAKLWGLKELPYGVLLSLAFAALGILIQLATNRPSHQEDQDEEEAEDVPVEKKGPSDKQNAYLDEMGSGLEDYADEYVDDLAWEDTVRYDIRRGSKKKPDEKTRKH